MCCFTSILNQIRQNIGLALVCMAHNHITITIIITFITFPSTAATVTASPLINRRIISTGGYSITTETTLTIHTISNGRRKIRGIATDMMNEKMGDSSLVQDLQERFRIKIVAEEKSGGDGEVEGSLDPVTTC